MATEDLEPCTDAEEAYFYEVLPKLPKDKQIDEARRAFTLMLAVDRLPDLRHEHIVQTASDMAAFLERGTVPGRGVQAVTVMAMDEHGKVVR